MEAELAIPLAVGWLAVVLFFVSLCAGAKRGIR